ncbi:MAG: DUF72 domain-containing protein [Cyclobacteriaceae bacterium]|nr:DUF72 domain-containing protein [Cyclobacteriaceae bacterium]
MDFGKVESENLDEIDFKLPPDAPGTKELLEKQKPKKTPSNILVGCAKWGRKDWVGKIYPEKTKEADFLVHYAQNFTCIELNATFYRMPTEAQVTGWKNKVGKGFKFCPKFVDQISHFKRLKDAEEVTNQFLKGVSAFGDNLGPIFLQLPPNFPPKNFDVLEKYLAFLPKDIDVFVELRSPKWFETKEESERVFDMFEKYKKGAVITDASGRRDCVHMRLTTPEAFLRFVGNGLHPTDYTRCDDWIARIKSWMDQKIDTVYFFMHQHEELHSPELCKYVVEKMNKKLGTDIPVPRFVQ